MQLTTRSAAIWVFCAALCALGGWKYADTISTTPPPVAETRTLERTLVSTERRTKLVTVRVRGKVIRRHAHVLVVYVPRVVFHTHTTPPRRVVVPAHVVKVYHRPATPSSPPVALVAGVAPPPVTIDVPVTVTVPVTQTVEVPVTSVSVSTETITLPQATTTVSVPVTFTDPTASTP